MAEKRKRGGTCKYGGCMGEGSAADLAVFAAFVALAAADLGEADLVGIFHKSFGLFSSDVSNNSLRILVTTKNMREK